MRGGPAETSLDDSARFQPRDPAALVLASFACPLCLRRASRMSLIDIDAERAAKCRCTTCEAAWTVGMEAEQFLRVMLAPPLELVLMGSAH